MLYTVGIKNNAKNMRKLNHDIVKRIGSTRPPHEHADTKWDWQAIMAVIAIMIVIAVFRYIS